MRKCQETEEQQIHTSWRTISQFCRLLFSNRSNTPECPTITIRISGKDLSQSIIIGNLSSTVFGWTPH